MPLTSLIWLDNAPMLDMALIFDYQTAHYLRIKK